MQRYNAVLSSLVFVAASFAISANAATTSTITYLKNPTTYQVTLNGVLHKPSNYSKCANLSDARLWNKYYWCPSSVGTLTAEKVAALNSTTTTTSSTTTTAPTVTYLLNPTTYQVTLDGKLYKPSNYSKCADLSSARLWNKYYWCPSSVGTLSAEKVAQLNSTTTTSGSTSTGSTSGSTTTTAPTAPVTYTAKLSWAAPSTREDGTPLSLSELKGYEIYYTSDDLAQSVTQSVSGASISTLSVPNLKAGTYHFAISAIDSKGVKSKLSSTVSAKLGS